MKSAPLSRLPLELHFEIANNLELHDKVRLSAINHYFRTAIKPTLEEFLNAEASPWAMSRNLYTCEKCVRFHRLVHFSDSMRKGKFSRNGKGASTRLCIKCGVESGFYTKGTTLMIFGKRYEVCGPSCSKFTDRANMEDAGGSLHSYLRPIRNDQDSQSTNHDCGQHEDHLTKFHAGGRHSDEWYGVWSDNCDDDAEE